MVTSSAAHEVRVGHITRGDAIALVKKFDQEAQPKYLTEMSEYLGIDEERYGEVVDGFRLPYIWKKVRGEWKLRHASNLDGAGA